MTLLMALLVLLQSLALVMALAFSRVYFILDAEAFRLFNNTTNTRGQAFDTEVGVLVGNMATETAGLNERLNALAEDEGVLPGQFYLNDEAYTQAALTGSTVLMRLLAQNSITGAFMMLNGSNASKGDDTAHSAVYIRNSAPGSTVPDNANYQLEIGPTAVSRQQQISTSIRWELDVQFDAGNTDHTAFYDQPIWAAAQYPGAEMERYGYWSAPGTILKDNQQVVFYTMPLLDTAGNAYGVLGIEISLPHFTQRYLPNADLPYQNSFYAIASVKEDDLSLEWFIPSGPLAQVYLHQGEHLLLEDVQDAALFSTTPGGLGKMYCSVQTLTMYSQNSPFADQTWSLVGFVPQSVLHESSSSVSSTLTISVAVTTLVAFGAIFLLAFWSTRKISGLSKYVHGMSPNQEIHFKRTGMREIDELTSAVERLNESAINASKTTSKILELTLLPIGGFEVSSESEEVILTGFIYQLLHIEAGTPVTKLDWVMLYEQLTAHPEQGLENIYRYVDPRTDHTMWLRMKEAATPTGMVGVILDVTRDVEENRRLAHELDYDALTHLYNRTAFKREAHLKIQARPNKVGAMIFCDLDNLKYVNDTYGHETGDRLIIKAGEMFREFDLCGGVVSRISGDEFAIYLHGFNSKEEAREVIHKQLRLNEKHRLATPDGSKQRIRFSSGIAWYPQDSNNITDLLKLSDYAMYEAKHNEKGAVYEFSRESYQENAYLLENREAINRLLDEGLIRFAFQPIVDLRTGDIYAYEALMRPMLEDFKSPMEILSVAEAQSKLGQLERLVMFTAFQAISEHVQELDSTKIFINSIPSYLTSDEDTLLLRHQYGHLFKHVVVEIIEAENKNPQTLKDKVAFVQSAGMKLALDDFGSGYSNEIRILTIQPDIVKIDMEMIQGIDHNTDKQKLVANIVSFCHSKGIPLVAEGVETREELTEIIRMNVDYVQGYYTGRPNFEFLPIDPERKQEILGLQAVVGNRPKPEDEDDWTRL